MTSPSSEDPIAPVITRLLGGAGTPEDDAALRAWLAADPGRERQLTRLRTIWNESGTLLQGWDTAPLQRRILRAVEDKELPVRPERRARLFESGTQLLAARRRAWIPALAAVLLLAVGALFWRSGAPPSAPPAPQRPALTELATRRGQRAELFLSEGTRITLGVDSRLRYPEQVTSGASREVYLEGEAYFEVARDTLRPFLVHAGGTVTRVLGTRFGVTAYAEDRGVQVVVAEGKVSLAPPSGKDVVLGGGDLGNLEPGGVPTVRHGVDVTGHLAWVDGQLVFLDTPMSEVVRRLSRWYDLDVRLGDPSLANDPFTMSLRGNESPEHVLHTVAAAVGARVERRGTGYILLSSTGVR